MMSKRDPAIGRSSAPRIRQLFVAAAPGLDQDAFERKLYVIRRRAESRVPYEVLGTNPPRDLAFKEMAR